MGTATYSDRTLERIVAILVSLAVLAERAAGRSFPVRWLILSILRRAEAAAFAYAAAMTQCEWPCFEDPAESRNGPADALLLAARLRALATALATLLPAPLPSWGRSGPIDHAPGRLAPLMVWLFVAPGRRAAGPHDTS